jgi:glycosyltransferase involved in cell wall biosynthesis
MISIIVPMLNEERTIGDVLDALAAFDTAEFDVEKEIIVADGGSTDRSVEIARARKVRVHQTKPGEGRGAAIRLGFSRARGNVLVVFPADGEYVADDIRSIVQPILRNQFKAVIGSRAIKCLNLETRIDYIYGGNRLLQMMSKYGGITLSVLSLLFYNRYITDPLSTLKGYDRALIESMNLSANGVDLECEIIAKASRRREFILEVPVSYTPRTRAQGKKTTARDGFSAIAALFRYRRG